MGLAAFIVFVVPWMLFAAWMFRLPSAIRLGAPSAPWRPLTSFPDTSRNQQRQTNPYNTGADDGSELTGGDKHRPMDFSDRSTLGSSVEPTEPKE